MLLQKVSMVIAFQDMQEQQEAQTFSWAKEFQVLCV